jgi:2-polyprenyl-3-methyl-5-hydroxy-6-metoxy-1,4-benzoquinol methylase
MAAILGSEHRCKTVFDLNLYGYIYDVMLCMDVML